MKDVRSYVRTKRTYLALMAGAVAVGVTLSLVTDVSAQNVQLNTNNNARVASPNDEPVLGEPRPAPLPVNVPSERAQLQQRGNTAPSFEGRANTRVQLRDGVEANATVEGAVRPNAAIDREKMAAKRQMTRTEVRALRADVKAEVQAKRSEVREDVRARRTTLEDRFEAKKTDVRERFQKTAVRLNAGVKNRVANTSANIEAKAEQHLTKLNGILTGLEARVADLESRGADTTAAVEAMAVATVEIEEARAEIAELGVAIKAQLEAEVTATVDTAGAMRTVTEILNEAKVAVRNAIAEAKAAAQTLTIEVETETTATVNEESTTPSVSGAVEADLVN